MINHKSINSLTILKVTILLYRSMKNTPVKTLYAIGRWSIHLQLAQIVGYSEQGVLLFQSLGIINVNKLVNAPYQFIISGFIVLKMLNRDFDLFMARRHNLHAIIIDRV